LPALTDAAQQRVDLTASIDGFLRPGAVLVVSVPVAVRRTTSEGIAKPGTICLSEDAYRQVKSRLDLAVSDLGTTKLKNIIEPVRVYSLEDGKAGHAASNVPARTAHLSIVVLPFVNLSGDPAKDYIADVITEELTTCLSRMERLRTATCR
jgi:hypothetical protein